jgi:inner membrane protein
MKKVNKLPSAITHAVVSISSGLAISKGRAPKRFWALSMICAMLPDLDVLTLKLGISYGDFWGHRGFFHSIFFAVLLGLLIATVFFRKEGCFSKSWLFYALYFSAVSSTHGILDAFTNGGLGIALLSPFKNERYFFWATPISVSPLSVKAFISGKGIAILKNEIMWVWLPSIFVAIIGKLSFSHNAYKKQG